MGKKSNHGICTSTAAKTAAPELYDSMLSKGEDLLPAVLSLLEESEHNRRSAEIYMLYKDIMENLGRKALSYDKLTPPLPENSADGTEASDYVW